MQDYIQAAKKGEMTFTEAYVQAHNAKIELSKTPNPTNENFKEFEFLSTQLRTLTSIITEEAMKSEGYFFNRNTQLWYKTGKEQK